MFVKKIKMYQVDAFTDEVFTGNPAAVCVLEEWISDDIMQKIASENNLSETAFVVKEGDAFGIRWFTPTIEVALCGHATLATAHVLFLYYHYPAQQIEFRSRQSGELYVKKKDDKLTLDFPVDQIRRVEAPEELLKAFDIEPEEVFKGRTDYMLVFKNQEQVESAHPNMELLKETGARGIIITAPGDKVDFVSRFFGPGSGVDEDPVTGSAHTTLTPYWADRLGEKNLKAWQLSKRGGKLNCSLKKDRVKITGRAVTYLQGEIYV
jgi:PhzF family phenazine biosynthesis protein